MLHFVTRPRISTCMHTWQCSDDIVVWWLCNAACHQMQQLNIWPFHSSEQPNENTEYYVQIVSVVALYQLISCMSWFIPRYDCMYRKVQIRSTTESLLKAMWCPFAYIAILTPNLNSRARYMQTPRRRSRKVTLFLLGDCAHLLFPHTQQTEMCV